MAIQCSQMCKDEGVKRVGLLYNTDTGYGHCVAYTLDDGQFRDIQAEGRPNADRSVENGQAKFIFAITIGMEIE